MATAPAAPARVSVESVDVYPLTWGPNCELLPPRAARRSGRPVTPRPIARHRAASIALPPGREVAGFQALAGLQPEDADPLLQQLAQQLGVGGVDRHVAAPPNVERGL